MVLSILTAIIALLLLLYVPGMLISRSIGLRGDPLQRLYENVAISALLSGWLALLLASFGIFSPGLHLTLLALPCVLLALFLFGSGRKTSEQAAGSKGVYWTLLAWLLVGGVALYLYSPPFQTVLGVRDAAVYANAGFSMARTGSLVQHDPLLAELGQQAQASDPAQRDPAAHALSNFLGVQNPERFIATRLYTAGFLINEGEMLQGRIVPQHLHLFPAWIALLTGLAGLTGGLFAPVLMGVLGAWSAGMLGRRLASSPVGWLAFLFLVLNSVQVWFARSTTSETTMQFLTFAGLYFFACFQQERMPVPPPHRIAATPPPPRPTRAAIAYAALAGLAVGQLALTRIDFFLVVGPLLLYLLYCLVSRRWHAAHRAMALGLGAMLLHAALHIIFIARAYFFDTAFARLQDYALTSYIAQPFITPLLREVYHTTVRSPFKDPLQIWRELAALALIAVLLLALWRWSQPLRWLERGLWHGRGLLAGAMALLILLLSGYAYLVRPQILTPALLAELPTCVQPENWQTPTPVPALAPGREIVTTPPRNPCLTLQGYIGAPIDLPPPPPGLDEKYVIPLANMVRLGWYISPLGIVLGVLGFALWWWRGFNRASWLFLVVGLLGTFFFVRDTYGTSDQTYIYILRRFVPVAYPAFSLGMAYALTALAAWGRARKQEPAIGRWEEEPRRASPLVRGVALLGSGGLTLLLLAFFVWTGRPIYQHVEYRGAIEQLAELADRFGPDDVLLLRGGAPTYHQARDVPDLIATPLRFAFGLNALTVKSSEPSRYADALAQQVRRWQAEGRAVYLLLSASGGDFTLAGLDVQRVGSFLLDVPEFEQLTDQKPRNVATLRLPFTLYRLSERQPGQIATVDLPLTATDFAAQVRGFYLPEEPQREQAVVNPDQVIDRVYAWTDGDALLRIPWQPGALSGALNIRVAGGQRPPPLQPARLCLSILPETRPWPAVPGSYISLECLTVSDTPQTYRVVLNPQRVPFAPTGSALLRLESTQWVPAEIDPQQHDQRAVGVQFISVMEAR